ncbi:MAG: alpha-glucan family phosphorylase [Planctomycetota bacterium]|nr:alpha-glucan family phosphorylase [Planctomycetota bacterium]
MERPLPRDVPGIAQLTALALDMRWSWNHCSDTLWRTLDPTLWDLTQNPWAVLQTVSHDRLAAALAEPAFRAELDSLTASATQGAAEPAWFQRHHPDATLSSIAYFSMEFMLSEALPIYSGGLGNVAGDQLKAASDLGIPVVGIGLLYQRGYFRQEIDHNGAQQALYPFNDPGQLPITPLRMPSGEWLRLEVSFPGYSVWLRTWQVQVGRVRLYLLDSNDAANTPSHRGITSELYGGGPEVRLNQELVLGIGGWRLLSALGIQPDVCHLNEGHAAFAVLERALGFMKSHAQPFDVALTATRAGNLFTTHTAVAAGFDRFPPSLIEQYLGSYAAGSLGISLHQLLALGRVNADDPAEPFNMAYLAMRGSGRINAVSRLHGEVSRELFAPLFPRWPVAEVPISHITNGVHTPTWDSAGADDLWTTHCGKHRWLGSMGSLETDIRAIPIEQLWKCRMHARSCLVTFARERLARELAAGGAESQVIAQARQQFDPSVLTLGFARRFASYKRPNLLLHDPQRLLLLLTNPKRPVQLIMAGKAHPADLEGQQLIQQWTHFIRQPEVRPHAMFLADYDMHLTMHLVQGVDVWLNTPRRPWEACGTSGMKVLVNGGLNCSVLDGWWAESYEPDLGWAIGDGHVHPATNEGMREQDAADAERLYALLEQQIIPEFYDRDSEDVPLGWTARVRESMARLTPRFSANRSVREYAELHYLPAAAAYQARMAQGGRLAVQIEQWKHALDAAWPRLRGIAVAVKTTDQQHTFKTTVDLAGLDPDAVCMELFANGVMEDESPGRFSMHREPALPEPRGTPVTSIYSAQIAATRPASDYTVRIIPNHVAAMVPLEAHYVLWAH